MLDSPLLGFGTPGDDLALTPLNNQSIAYSNFLVVKTGPGILYGFTIYSSNTVAQFIQIYDAAILPADGAIPACVFTVAGVSNLPVQYLPGRTFLNGCVLVNSSTGPTKTVGSADCWFDAQFL